MPTSSPASTAPTSKVVMSVLPDGAEAGAALGREIAAAWAGETPDAVLVFAAPQYNQSELLAALQDACQPRVLVGCSSAGEFTHFTQAENAACAVALRSPQMHFAAALGEHVSQDPRGAARQIVASFEGMQTHRYRHRAALILVDALAGHTEELVNELTLQTAGNYQFVGGGAGDNAQFQRTPVFYGTQVTSDAAVVLEILSNTPIGIGVRHGWEPATPGMRVTRADGMRLISVNARPAADMFDEYARETGQVFDHANPIPFFLHNVVGVAEGAQQKLRVPLVVHEDGSIACAADVPEGATIHIMRASTQTAMAAAAQATEEALEQLGDHEPGVALFFDCVATRLRLGREFGLELGALQNALGPIPLVGCNTHGQVARAEGQFSGFHNCTAVVCVLSN